MPPSNATQGNRYKLSTDSENAPVSQSTPKAKNKTVAQSNATGTSKRPDEATGIRFSCILLTKEYSIKYFFKYCFFGKNDLNASDWPFFNLNPVRSHKQAERKLEIHTRIRSKQMNPSRVVLFLVVFLLRTTFSFGQIWQKFSGKSVVLDALQVPVEGACSLRYGGNIKVRVDEPVDEDPDEGSVKVCPAGQSPMDQINDCTSPNKFIIGRNLVTSEWEFWGQAPTYRVKLTHSYGGTPADKDYSYHWVPDKDVEGFFNVKDFGAKGDGTNDDWYAVQSALAYAATRNGGIVYFPRGDYVLSFGVTVPSGVSIRGAGGLVSGGLTNFTGVNRGPTRIRLFPNVSGAIFYVGECSQQIRFESLELNGTTSGENFGVEFVGKQTTSQDFQFSNVGFTNLNIGTSPCSLASSGGGSIAVVNTVAGSLSWQCQ